MRESQHGLEARRRGGRSRRGLVFSLLLLSLPTAALAQGLYCPDCHNPNGIPVPHDTGCRDTPCSDACHSIGITQLNHQAGPGTPTYGVTDRTAYCNGCHNAPWNGVYHPYTVNVLAGSPTAPGSVDLDQACGRCHGGGIAQDAQHQPVPPALYRTKAALGPVAGGIHDFAGVSYPVAITAVPSNLTIVASAVVACGGPCPVLTYDWAWGDGTQDLGSGATASHTYPAPGTYAITVTVRAGGLRAGGASGSVTVANVDLPPTAAGTCTWSANTWTMTVRDASTDTDSTPVRSITLMWGDGTLNSIGGPGALFSHVYLAPGMYIPTLKAVDTALNVSNPLFTCPTPAVADYFRIRGTVYRKDGTMPASSALVSLRQGSATIKTVSTGANGSFSFVNLKPGTYSITVTRTGYTFAPPPQVPSVIVGPDRVDIVIRALAP